MHLGFPLFIGLSNLLIDLPLQMNKNIPQNIFPGIFLINRSHIKISGVSSCDFDQQLSPKPLILEVQFQLILKCVFHHNKIHFRQNSDFLKSYNIQILYGPRLIVWQVPLYSQKKSQTKKSIFIRIYILTFFGTVCY